MKRNLFKKIYLGALAVLLCATTARAQQRFGGGGFGGFGGFGGGNNFRAASSSTTSAYNNNGTVGTATISVDPVTHNIIVIADKDTSEQIGRVIASMDEPEPQVLIKVVFLEVQRNDGSVIGVQGSYTGGSLGGNFGKQLTGFMTNGFSLVGSNLIANVVPQYQNFNVANNFSLPQTLAGAAGSGGVYSVMGSQFTATLQAIATAGRAEVLSRPSILARDGQLAEIVVGQSIYLPSGVSFTEVGGSSTTVPTINGNYQNVGIQLDVTPFIGANNLIEMILQPQTTSIDTSTPGQQIVGSSLFSGAVFAPNINKRSANTVVVTPDAQPVVIGGLMSNDKSSSESKVPFLGDIPFFGQLFKTTSKADQKTELLIFLTPHIVRAPVSLPGMATAEMNQMSAVTNSVSEDELDRFLERLPVKKK